MPLASGQGRESEVLGLVGGACRPKSCGVIARQSGALLSRLGGVGLPSCRRAACLCRPGRRASPVPWPVLNSQGSCDKSSVRQLWLADCSSLTGFLRGAGKVGELMSSSEYVRNQQRCQLLNAVKGEHKILFLHKQLLGLPLVL